MFLKDIFPEEIPTIGAIFYSKVVAKVFQERLKRIAEEIEIKEGLILDIGTGPGFLPVAIAKKEANLRIIGIDISKKMIEIANRNKRGFNNVEFKVMDANHLEFEDNTFNMIVSTGSLHHWKTPLKVLSEIYRCLRPGGNAWIYDGYAEATLEDLKRGITRKWGIFPPYFLLQKILRIHGFTAQEYQTKIKDLIAKSAFKRANFFQMDIYMKIEVEKNTK